MKIVSLPSPKETSKVSLYRALCNRRSIRSFSTRPIDLQTLSNILFAAGGVNEVFYKFFKKKHLFTNPTASNHQEVEIYVFSAEGIFKYQPIGHQLIQQSTVDIRGELGKLPFFAYAPISLCLVSNIGKMHYTDDFRRDLYSAMDIGYVSQNIYLHCAANNLSTVACGLIDREHIASLLSLTVERVMLVHPIGIKSK